MSTSALPLPPPGELARLLPPDVDLAFSARGAAEAAARGAWADIHPPEPYASAVAATPTARRLTGRSRQVEDRAPRPRCHP